MREFKYGVGVIAPNFFIEFIVSQNVRKIFQQRLIFGVKTKKICPTTVAVKAVHILPSSEIGSYAFAIAFRDCTTPTKCALENDLAEHQFFSRVVTSVSQRARINEKISFSQG